MNGSLFKNTTLGPTPALITHERYDQHYLPGRASFILVCESTGRPTMSLYPKRSSVSREAWSELFGKETMQTAASAPCYWRRWRRAPMCRSANVAARIYTLVLFRSLFGPPQLLTFFAYLCL